MQTAHHLSALIQKIEQKLLLAARKSAHDKSINHVSFRVAEAAIAAVGRVTETGVILCAVALPGCRAAARCSGGGDAHVNRDSI